MPTHGLLKKVYDNAGHWGIIIDVDDHGEHRLNLWDKTFAGQKSGAHEAVCDVHNWEGMRIIYTAKKGKPKDDDPADCWPATIEMIALEDMKPAKSVKELAEEIATREERDKAIIAEAIAETKGEAPLVEPEPERAESHDVRNLDELTRLTMEWMNAGAKVMGEIKRILEEV